MLGPKQPDPMPGYQDPSPLEFSSPYQHQGYNNSVYNNNSYTPQNQQNQNKYPLYSTTIFHMPNPRAGVITLEVNNRNGKIYLTLTPALPNNPGMTCKGPIPKGSRCFDYEKKVSTSLTHVECCNIIDFIKFKIGEHSSSNIQRGMDANEVMNFITQLKTHIMNKDVAMLSSSISTMMSKVTAFISSGNSNKSVLEQESSEIPPLYRKASKGQPNKIWNLNWVDDKQTLYIRCTLNGDKNQSIYMGLSKKNLISFCRALESYISSYTLHLCMSETAVNFENVSP